MDRKLYEVANETRLQVDDHFTSFSIEISKVESFTKEKLEEFQEVLSEFTQSFKLMRE